MTLMPLENQKIGKHLSHIRIATRDQMRALKDPQDRNDMRYIIAQAKLLEKQTRTLVADAKRVHDRATRRKILEDAMVMFRLAEKGLKQIQRSWKIGTEGSYLDQLLQMDTHDVYGGIWGFVEGIRKTYRIKMVRVKGRRFKAYGVKSWENAYRIENGRLFRASRQLAKLARDNKRDAYIDGFDLGKELMSIVNELRKELGVGVPFQYTGIYDAIRALPLNKRKAYKEFFWDSNHALQNFVIAPDGEVRALDFLIRLVARRRNWIKQLGKAQGRVKSYGVKSLGDNEVLETIGLVDRLANDAKRGYDARTMRTTLNSITNRVQNLNRKNPAYRDVMRNVQALAQVASKPNSKKQIIDTARDVITALGQYRNELRTTNESLRKVQHYRDAIRELRNALNKIERNPNEQKQQQMFEYAIKQYERVARNVGRALANSGKETLDVSKFRKLFYDIFDGNTLTKRGISMRWTHLAMMLSEELEKTKGRGFR